MSSMSSELHHHRGILVTKNNGFLVDEDIANDLEVAMINETFEEQLKQTQPQQCYDVDLKSLFYGEGLANKNENLLQTNLAPESLHQSLPSSEQISFNEDDAERGRQLDIELDRMMLDEDDTCPNVTNSPQLPLNIENTLPIPLDIKLPAIPFPPVKCEFSAFDSQVTNDDSDECVEAAKAIANNVIQFLFADENNSSDLFFGDDDNTVVSSSILNILNDEDDVISFIEEMDDDPKNNENSVVIMPPSDKIQMSPRDSLRTASSPMSVTDEQTVPVFDSWEELAKEPMAAKKMCNDASVLLKKIRAERKATQL